MGGELNRPLPEMLFEQSSDMLELINTMLEISQTGCKLDRTPREDIDLCAFLRETVELYATVLDDQKLALNLDLPKESVVFSGHRGRLQRLLGNLLDNAIEAVSEVQQKGKRYINLSLRQLGEGIVRIECMNYYEGDRIFHDGLPKSTKGDDLNHGFGMRSIRQIAQKYSGEMSVSAEEGVFSVAIVFYRIQNAF